MPVPDYPSIQELAALPVAGIALYLMYRMTATLNRLMSNHLEHMTDAVLENTKVLRELKGFIEGLARGKESE